MTDQEFANIFFLEAKNNGFQNTSHGNIRCLHGKNLSHVKLVTIHQLLGSKCENATSIELTQAGIQPCCFTIFRYIAGLIYP